jgi:Zn ribbon nucleic-acid-binding protein
MSASASKQKVERIDCPLCHADKPQPWGHENGFDCVRCGACGLLYVNPRPVAEHIDRAVQLGVHEDEKLNMNVVGCRIASKVDRFRAVVQRQFPEIRPGGKPIRWLDVGAGFGELVEAVTSIMPHGSACEGIEPMLPKSQDAQRRGLPVRAVYMQDVKERYDVVSLIDVFSHIPDFHAFLKDVKALLNPRGEVFLKTGNAADLKDRAQFPGPLTLPDHLTFGGEPQVRRFLEEAGFEIVDVRADRMDGILYSIRNLAKWILRRPVCLSLPYTSPARILWIRARLRA